MESTEELRVALRSARVAVAWLFGSRAVGGPIVDERLDHSNRGRGRGAGRPMKLAPYVGEPNRF